jgi:nitroreductase
VPDEMGLFEAIYTQRAIRAFKHDPIPDHLITTLLQAAVKAPTGGASQNWRFIVIRDLETRRKIAEMYRAGPDFVISADMTPQQRRVYASAQRLEDNMEQVPAFILACIRVYPGYNTWGATIYPAVQNILLAARVLGLGSVLTTRAIQYAAEFRKLLDIPEDVQPAALLPIGYPAEGARYGPTTRRPIEDVAFSERWGNSWQT